jgi:hypothetical protein
LPQQIIEGELSWSKGNAAAEELTPTAASGPRGQNSSAQELQANLSLDRLIIIIE